MGLGEVRSWSPQTVPCGWSPVGLQGLPAGAGAKGDEHLPQGLPVSFHSWLAIPTSRWH